MVRIMDDKVVRSVGGGTDPELFERGGDVEDKNPPKFVLDPPGGFRVKVLRARICRCTRIMLRFVKFYLFAIRRLCNNDSSPFEVDGKDKGLDSSNNLRDHMHNSHRTLPHSWLTTVSLSRNVELVCATILGLNILTCGNLIISTIIFLFVKSSGYL